MNQFFKDTLPPVLMILAIYFTVCGFIMWASNYLNQPETIIVRNETVMQQTPVRFSDLSTQEN